MSTSTAYLWDEAFLGHKNSTVHPENPKRAEALNPVKMIKDVPGLTPVKLDEPLGGAWVRRVHDHEYVSQVREKCAQGARALDAGDTRVQADSYDVALQSAAGALSVVRAVGEGKAANGFAAVRPPGHHAGVAHARGFCIFNNIALCARFAQQALGHQRVLIIDWDVHPADGTSSIFYDDRDVHVFSIHQHGIFSEKVGLKEHTGTGEGLGATHNVPLPVGSNTDQYLRAFEPELDRAAALCRPDFVLISCGFDAHTADPLGGMKLDENSFRRFTTMVKKIADRYAGGRLVSVLEGGYNPEVLARCVRAHLEIMMT